MSEHKLTRETILLFLGSLTVVVLLFLFLYQALTPDYSVANRTIIIIAGMIYAFLQVDILGNKLNVSLIGIESSDSQKSTHTSPDESEGKSDDSDK